MRKQTALLLILAFFALYTLPEGAAAFTSDEYEYTVSVHGDAAITKYIGQNASVTVPDILDGYPVVSIGDFAFSDHFLIEFVSLPAGIRSVGDGVFLGCDNLVSIDVSPDNTAFTSINGVLFGKEGGALVAYPSGKKDAEYVVPTDTLSINAWAFFHCKHLTSIQLPDSLEFIGEGAFSHCDALALAVAQDSCAHQYAREYGISYEIQSAVPQQAGAATPEGNADHTRLSNITDILLLGKYTATFQINVPDGCSADIAAKLISEGWERQGEIADSGRLEFSQLKADTDYQLTIYNAKDHQVIDEIAFKTFNNDGKREFQYFTDVRNGDAGIVKMKVFVDCGSITTLKMRRIAYHVQNLDLKLIGDVTVNGKAIPVNPENYSFTVSIPEGRTSVIEYSVDRNYENVSGHGSEGALTGRYFMCSGEQFLILPDENYFKYGYLYSISFITDNGWHSSAGLDRIAYGSLYVSDHPRSTAMVYYAYDPAAFIESQKEISGTPVTALVEKGVTLPYAKALFEVYEDLCELWGGDVSDIPYAFMVIDDSRAVYGGEYDTGGGFSDAFGLGEMFVHQVYHRWQGWDVGIPWSAGSPPERMFWLEGLNDYFCYVILLDKDYATQSGASLMRGYYDTYLAGIQKGIDRSLLKEQTDDLAVYYKGACLAYLLDQEIQDKSGGAHSLGDVLKYFYREYMEKQSPFSYEKMLACIETLIDGDIYDWWRRYLVDNEQFALSGF